MRTKPPRPARVASSLSRRTASSRSRPTRGEGGDEDAGIGHLEIRWQRHGDGIIRRDDQKGATLRLPLVSAFLSRLLYWDKDPGPDNSIPADATTPSIRRLLARGGGARCA